MSKVYVITDAAPHKPADVRGKPGSSIWRYRGLIIGTVILVGGALIVWNTWPGYTPPVQSDPAELVKFFASDSFLRLDTSRQQEYVDHIMQLPRLNVVMSVMRAKLSTQEMTGAMENVMNSGIRLAMIDDYFALPNTGEARRNYLDKLIDKQEQDRKGLAAMFPKGSRPSMARDVSTLKRRLENTPPERRAAMAELMAAVRNRRAERGLPELGPH